VLTALDALALAPDRFNMEANVYLGLRSIFWQLAHAKNDDSLREVVARMWDMAVNLEDGNVSDAQQALRNAEDALRQALERGATDEEIKRLTDDLRAALDKFMQALAEQLRQNPQQNPLDRNAQRMRPQDLQSMIDQIEKLARSGARDAARDLLSQMQSMLNNLQAQMEQGQPQDDVDDEMQAMMDELSDLTRQQQELRDKTFEQSQNQRRQQGQRGQQNQPGQRGQQGQQQGKQGDQNGMGDLAQRQQALRDQLKKLLEEMRKNGMGQEQGQGQQGQGQQGQGGDQLGQADEAMGDAQSKLGQGNADGAVDSQGQALDALRRGMAQAQQQQQQQQGMGQGGRPGGPGRAGRLGPARAQQDTDPLGRPLRGRDYGDDSTVRVPGEIDVQRARRILEELRKRFGEIARPQLELDYIERLLKDY
jgi:uncharacterized protein (TIGR02302 family)